MTQKKNSVNGKNERFDLDRKVVTLVVFSIICAILLIVLVNVSVNTGTGIRALVTGNSYWAQSQKESIIHLTNFIFTEDEEEFEHFHNSLRVNFADNLALQELKKEDYEYQVVYENLLKVHNHPDDIPHIINTLNRFQWLDEMQKAIIAWEKGDEKIEELVTLAEQVQSTINNEVVSEEQRRTWSESLEDLDHEFTAHEVAFSNALGNVARAINRTLRWSIISLGLILLASGMWLTYRFLNSAHTWMNTLQESEEKYRTLLRNSRDVIYRMSLKKKEYTYVSPTLKDMLGYEVEEFLKGGPTWIFDNIHPEDKENMARVIEKYERAGKTNFLPIVEFRLKDKSGAYRWVSNARTLVKNEQGEPEAIIGSVRDISEIKKQDEQLRSSLEDKEILLQEIHHRVKNNLTIVSSLLELQKEGMSEDVQEMLSASQSRIKSIAKVHEKLYKSTTLSNIPMDVYISELAEEISKAYASSEKNIDMQIDVDSFEMDINQAIPCGLILNELINNSYKHGFEGLKEGKLHISLKKKGEQTELAVANTGNKLPDDFKFSQTTSLGMTLVTVLLKRFDGEISYKSGEWTRFIITWKDE